VQAAPPRATSPTAEPIGLRAFTGPRRSLAAAEIDDCFPIARPRFSPPSRSSTSVSTSTSLLHRVFGRRPGALEPDDMPDAPAPDPAPTGDSPALDHPHPSPV
jgi:hypothetical protein